ncbi:MAG: hypothetical protein KDI31_07545, partial [Pseudomonadales bacterium]|nr:hypothetical protein [Pseudomonadales bacterium]
KVVRSSGTLISAEVSLGYDVHRNQIRDALKAAAETADLKEPFVQIVSLNDHAVVYQVLGFLEDVSNLVSKRTELNSRVLDSLHAAGIEIVSPAFVNQRRLDPAYRFIPGEHTATTPEDTEVEKLMFDKAELAGHLSTLRHQKEELEAEIDDLKSSAEPSPAEITWRENQIRSLEQLIDSIETE